MKHHKVYRTELSPVSFLQRSAYVFPGKPAVVRDRRDRIAERAVGDRISLPRLERKRPPAPCAHLAAARPSSAVVVLLPTAQALHR